MLKLIVPPGELYDEAKGEFIYTKETVLQLEHSLLSLSNWEQKWHKPFMGKTEKTDEEVLDYVRCMTITQNVDPNVYLVLTEQNFKDINDYILDPRTATTINDQSGKKNREIITNEIIYYWMTELNIPPEYAKWHLNHLLTLIEVASIKKQPPKKMSKKDILNRNRNLNALRKKQLGTTG